MTRKIAVALAALALLIPLGRSLAQDARAPRRPAITGLAHVGIFVKDLDASRRFYEDYFGYAEPYTTQAPDGSVRVAWIKVNDRQSIALLPAAVWKSQHGNRLSIDHIAFATDDAAAMRDYLAAKGVTGLGGKKLSDKVTMSRMGEPYFMFEDPDGHALEFCQYTPDGWTRRNQGQALPATRISGRMTHAGIAIGAGDRVMDFYCDVLGFKMMGRSQKGGGTARVPEGDDWLEFMLASPERMPRINHICLELSDLPAAVAVLKGRSCPPGALPPEPIKLGANRKLQSSCFDPDGTRVELMEPHVKG